MLRLEGFRIGLSLNRGYLRRVLPLPKKALPIVVLGLALRFALAPFTGHPFDMNNIYTDSQVILNGGVPTSDLANVPMFYYILVPISYAYSAVSHLLGIYPTSFSSLPAALKSVASWTVPSGAPINYVTDWAYNLILKIPYIVSDFVGGLVLYAMVYPKYGEKVSIMTFTLWFLNPMLIWVSSVWGMWDTLAATFTLLATYLLLRNNLSLSALCLAVATGFKDYAVVLAIPMLVYAYKAGNGRRVIVAAAVFVGATLLLFSPFLSQAISHNSGMLNPSGNPAQNPSLTYGLTYWSVAPLTLISGAMVTMTSIVVLIVLGIVISVMTILKLRTTQNSLFFWELASISVVFLSYPRINEQWFVWLLPFLILLSAKSIDRLLVLYLSILALAYSLVSSMFVSFFIPMYHYVQEGLINAAQSVLFLSYYRLYAMSILGIVFSILLATTLVRTYLKDAADIRKQTALSVLPKK